MNQKIDRNYEYGQIARERMLWAIKPIGLVVLMVWVVHPATTKLDVVDHNTLLGFLLGAAFSIVLNMRVLKYFLVVRRQNTRNQRNRVPDEFYFGKIIDRLFSKN